MTDETTFGGPVCPECRALHRNPGIIFDEGSSSTLMAWTPYWDGAGYHSHNPNRITQNYRCDQGHRWSQVIPRSCKCGWRSDQ